MWDTILFFGYGASKDALSRVVQTWGHDVTSGRYVRTLRRVPVMTSRSDVIRDVTRHVCRGYKTAWHRIVGDTLVQLLLGGTRARMKRRAGAPALREPTSFKYSWLGCSNSPACIRVCRRTHNTPRTARECHVLPKEYRLHRTVVPFGWCPFALFIELLFTSPET